MSNIVQKRGINSLIFVQIYTIIPTNQKYQNKKDRKNLLYQKKSCNFALAKTKCCCFSSVVERILGKDEVPSSTLGSSS